MYTRHGDLDNIHLQGEMGRQNTVSCICVHSRVRVSVWEVISSFEHEQFCRTAHPSLLLPFTAFLSFSLSLSFLSFPFSSFLPLSLFLFLSFSLSSLPPFPPFFPFFLFLSFYREIFFTTVVFTPELYITVMLQNYQHSSSSPVSG